MRIPEFSRSKLPTPLVVACAAGSFLFCCGAPPDGEVAIGVVLAVIGGFSSVAGGAQKRRTDLEPGAPDLLINISDVLVNLLAFGGVPYPFTPPPGILPCPQ